MSTQTPSQSSAVDTIKKFETPGCAQCPKQAEILEDLVADRDITLEHIDATQQTDEANRYQVRGAPTTVLLDDDGTVIHQFSGLTQADQIEAHL